jgi:hypothetical protein
VETTSGDSIASDEFLDRPLVDMLIDVASFEPALAETEALNVTHFGHVFLPRLHAAQFTTRFFDVATT